MAFVLRVVWLLAFAFTLLNAYDFIGINSPLATIERSGYAVEKNGLTPEMAEKLFLEGRFMPLPKKGVSFGFDDRVYYFAFLIDNKSRDEELFLELKNPSFESVNLSVFRGDELVRCERNGYLIPKDKREVQDFPIRFLLDEGKALYIVEVSGKSPKFSAFALGEKVELDKSWYVEYILFFSTLGIFLFLLLFCLFFFIILKDTLYLYYIINNIGLFGAIVITQGFTWFLGEKVMMIGSFAAFFIQLQLVGLVFFSERFLEIKTVSKKLSKTLHVTLYASLALSALLFFDNNLKFLSFVFMVTLFLLLIFCASLAYRRGFTPAFYYLLATGVSMLLLIGFTLAHQGVLPYNFVTFNLLSFALLWEMVFFTLAIAQKVRLLQQENIEKERILTLRSKRESLGELSGNIAHQWRTPLAEIGAIISTYKAKLLYENPSADEGVQTLNRVDALLKHLSSTVETFQGFFQNNKNDTSFCLNKEVERSLSFVGESLKNNAITTLFASNNDQIQIKGNQNEFTQALLAIVLNAKDILIERDVKNAQIEIRVEKKEGFALLEIEDSGGGVKITPLEKIFDSFVSGREGGAGVGLFIAKIVVEKKLGGVLSVCNTKKGACFSIKLPLI